MGIIGMKKSNQVDSMMRITAGVQTASSQVSKELSLGRVRQHGGQVFRNQDGYSIKGIPSLSSQAMLDMIKRDNGSVQVKYKDEILDNDQISKTEEPLWVLDRNGDTFNLKRNF